MSLGEDKNKTVDGKRGFKYQRYGHFQAGCPNKRAPLFRKIEEIN